MVFVRKGKNVCCELPGVYVYKILEALSSMPMVILFGCTSKTLLLLLLCWFQRKASAAQAWTQKDLAGDRRPSCHVYRPTHIEG